MDLLGKWHLAKKPFWSKIDSFELDVTKVAVDEDSANGGWTHKSEQPLCRSLRHKWEPKPPREVAGTRGIASETRARAFAGNGDRDR